MGRTLDPELCDLERLLRPISAERPCGEWLRYEGIYELVRERRREDDASLPQGVWQSELKRADWPAVEQICADALANAARTCNSRHGCSRPGSSSMDLQERRVGWS